MANFNHHWDRVRLFIRTWKALAAYSFVDDWGGAEQRRVFEEWKEAGSPLPCREFILKHANEAPPVPTNPTASPRRK